MAFQAIKTLTENVDSARSALLPKRKFTFSKSKSYEHPSEVPSGSFVTPSPLLAPSIDTLAIVDPKDHHKKPPLSLAISTLSSSIYVPDESSLRPSVVLTEINDSVVDLSASATASRPFSTLTVRNVSKSLLICGETVGSAHFTDIKDSTIIIWTRQLRMHHSNSCVVYLRCSSRPIIENSNATSFARLPDSTVRRHEHSALKIKC